MFLVMMKDSFYVSLTVLSAKHIKYSTINNLIFSLSRVSYQGYLIKKNT